MIELCTYSAQNSPNQKGRSGQWWVYVTSKLVVYTCDSTVRITSAGGYDGLGMRRQRIRTKFWYENILGNVHWKYKYSSQRACEHGGWVKWLMIMLSGRNLQLTQYSFVKNENNEHMLGKLASNVEQSDYYGGFHTEGRWICTLWEHNHEYRWTSRGFNAGWAAVYVLYTTEALKSTNPCGQAGCSLLHRLALTARPHTRNITNSSLDLWQFPYQQFGCTSHG
jgi:hypothetical protein